MGIDLITTLISGIASLIGFSLLSNDFMKRFLRRLLGVKEPAKKPHIERLNELTISLTKASHEVDSILIELAQVAKNREESVQKLETDLLSLENREKELKDRIQTLEKTPLPVAEHFAKLLETGDKRSAKRDYLLFGAGVIVTTIIAVIIQLLVK